MATSGDLSMGNDDERSLHDSCQKGNKADAIRLLCHIKNVDCLDVHGMTPLQQAAYRGHLDVCQLLLDRGADVNSQLHEHGYTALMFAALCGQPSVVSLLLDAGASTTTVNSVRRNAAQMAAFVGNHECVSVINNYIPVADIEQFSNESASPCLMRSLVKPLHTLVKTTNVHPIAVILLISNQRQLLDAIDHVIIILDLMCRREATKNGHNQSFNEVLIIKLHLLARILEEYQKLSRKLLSEKELRDEKKVIRRWLCGGLECSLEKLIRKSILNFPYPHFPIVQQLVQTLTAGSSNGSASALALVTATIRGQRFGSEDEDTQCTVCGGLSKNNKKCSACKSIYYCGVICQKMHWFIHKLNCHEQRST